jgi:hypothetical protein
MQPHDDPSTSPRLLLLRFKLITMEPHQLDTSSDMQPWFHTCQSCNIQTVVRYLGAVYIYILTLGLFLSVFYHFF